MKKKIQHLLKLGTHLPRFAIKFMDLLFRRVNIKMDSSTLLPGPGNAPAMVLSLQVLGCTNLLFKDRKALNSFVVVSVLNRKSTTPVARGTVNPSYAAKDATFHFPINPVDQYGVVELVVWNKERLTNKYLGEVAISLADFFESDDSDRKEKEKPYEFYDPGNEPFRLDLFSTRENTPSAGSIQIKLGVALNHDLNSRNESEYRHIYDNKLLRRTMSTLNFGLARVRSNPANETETVDENDDDKFSLRRICEIREFELFAQQVM
ncbi:hypothetical protein GALMADRAFT_210687 [Galerina marginata CBS 339.88]|uniref:C2 domain-containing protein n=1 Tax=Galerina marginata (strain CBS 339.88) TaxID=685588 RepID=A0A067T3D6_GALM3|nr:hypothetical protein GALMADRAFT_210687 [Galerina marginata CBS 339.88]